MSIIYLNCIKSLCSLDYYYLFMFVLVMLSPMFELGEMHYVLTPKDPWVFGCKTTQNYPL
jgi:hypothetical protein